MSLASTIRYRALPERRRSKASLAFDIGNVSVSGAIECRALNASIWSIVVGLPTGEPDTDLWPMIKPNAGTSSGLRGGSNIVQATFGRKRIEETSNIQRRVDRGNDEVKSSGKLL